MLVHKFPSPSSTPSLIPLIHSFQETKEKMPEISAFITPAIASRERERPFKPAAPSRTTLDERKGSNKRGWSDDKTTQLINLWKQGEASCNSTILGRF